MYLRAPHYAARQDTVLTQPDRKVLLGPGGSSHPVRRCRCFHERWRGWRCCRDFGAGRESCSRCAGWISKTKIDRIAVQQAIVPSAYSVHQRRKPDCDGFRCRKPRGCCLRNGDLTQKITSQMGSCSQHGRAAHFAEQRAASLVFPACEALGLLTRRGSRFDARTHRGLTTRGCPGRS